MEIEIDHYQFLGLPSGEEGSKLTLNDISKAYRSKALDLHPDKRPDDPDANANFQTLKSSYEILRDEKARKLFDDLLRVKRQQRQRQSQYDSKRRRMTSDLEQQERDHNQGLKEEEERILKRFREEIEVIRAMHANQNSKGAAAHGLDGEKVLKVSWEGDRGDYSPQRLKEVFQEFGEVEDAVIRSNRAVSAMGSVRGDLSNPLLVVPLDEGPPTDVSSPFPCTHLANESSILEKLRKQKQILDDAGKQGQQEEHCEGDRRPADAEGASTSEEQLEDEKLGERKSKIEKRKRQVSSRLSTQVNWKKFFGFKCYFEELISNVNDIVPKFDERTIEILMQTPFGKFFDMIMKRNITKGMVESCSYNIIDIIEMYTGEGNAFMFKEGAEVVQLEAEEISLMFGIPLRGETFDTSDKGKQMVGGFETKYFNKAKRITKKELRNEMQTILMKKSKTEQDRIDIVKMLLLYSFATFFFATTNGGVAKIFLKKFESLTYVNNCSWPQLIHTFLMKSVKTHYKKPTSVSGCVYVLLYFLVEHADLLKPIKGGEKSSPRVLKWNLSKLTGDNWPEAFSRLENTKVNVSLTELTNEEKELLNMDRPMIEEEINEDINEIEEDDPIGMGDVSVKTLDDLCDAIDKQCDDNLEGQRDDTQQIDQNEDSRTEKDKKEEDANMMKERRSKRNIERPTTVFTRKVDKSTNIKGKKMESSEGEESNDDEEVREVDENLEEVREVDEEVREVDENLEEVDLKNLPDDTRQLRYLLRRECGKRERLQLKVRRRLEESEEQKKEIHDLKDESERFKAKFKRMSDYWNDAYDIYHRDNARIEHSFREYLGAYELERSTNERIKGELDMKIKHLNDAYASQTKLVQEMNKERVNAVEREQKLLKDIADASMKLFSCEVESENVDNKISIEGVGRCTPATKDTIKGLIVEVQSLKSRLNDNNAELKMAEETSVKMKNQLEELEQQKNVLDSELISEKERSRLVSEENEILKKTLVNAKQELSEWVNEVMKLNNTLEQYKNSLGKNKMLRLVPNTYVPTSTSNETEMKALKEENRRLVRELNKVSNIIEENTRLRSEKHALGIQLIGLNKMVEEQHNKNPEDQPKAMFAFPLSAVKPSGEQTQEKELKIVASEKRKDEAVEGEQAAEKQN